MTTPERQRRRTRTLVTLQGLTAIAAVLALWWSVKNQETQQHSAHETCKVQARGLPASHALAKVVGDWHFLITASLRLAGPHPKSLAKLPPALAFNVLWSYRDLSRASATYTRITATQPPSRRC